jgi:hypothetical protein
MIVVGDADGAMCHKQKRLKDCLRPEEGQDSDLAKWCCQCSFAARLVRSKLYHDLEGCKAVVGIRVGFGDQGARVVTDAQQAF